MKTTEKWLATRTLRDIQCPDVELEVQLGFPELLESGYWRCAYRVMGLDGNELSYCEQVDALQALLDSISSIAHRLRESGRSLSWLDMPGETGIRRQIPIFLGAEFANDVESIIDAMLNAYVERKQKQVEEEMAATAQPTSRPSDSKKPDVPTDESQPSCSFCGKSASETPVVAAPIGGICAPCTRLAANIHGIALAD